MPERTGRVATEHRATEATMQAAYTAFIVHVQNCAPCRTDGVDCATAETLRQEYRDATPKVAR